MKKIWLLRLVVLILALCVLGSRLLSLPDWVVRGSGIALLATLPVLAFSTVRLHRSKPQAPAGKGPIEEKSL